MAIVRWPGTRANKYHARRTTVDGHPFDSAKEASRYAALKLLHQAGHITALELQPTFPLWVLGASGHPVHVGAYLADFRYWDGTKEVVEDVKSPITATPLYRLKKKMVEAIYGITIIEI